MPEKKSISKIEEARALLGGKDWKLAKMTESGEIIDVLAGVVREAGELKSENDELQRLFDLQHSRCQEADRLWQKAHGKPNVLPDLGELIRWLLDQVGWR